jgi:hypothetical protein
MSERPEGMTEEHFEYLDVLRDSGATNMFGASAYIKDKFDLSSNVATAYLGHWMETFEERHTTTAGERK